MYTVGTHVSGKIAPHYHVSGKIMIHLGVKETVGDLS